MIKKSRAWFFIFIGVFLMTGCNLPAPKAPAANGPDLAATITAQARILQSSSSPASATATLTPQAAQPQASPSSTQPGSTPTATASLTATLSATPASSATPAGASVTVSQDTNCRTGPGQVYPSLYVLTAGTPVQVIGKNSLTGYWIIPVPGSASTACWLYPYFATVSGNTSGLKEYSVPATPTPAITNTPVPPAAASNLRVKNVACGPVDSNHFNPVSGTLSWVENSSNVSGFMICQNADWTGIVACGPVQLVTTLRPNTTSYAFNFGIFSAANFSLSVQAFNSGGTAPMATIDIQPNCP